MVIEFVAVTVELIVVWREGVAFADVAMVVIVFTIINVAADAFIVVVLGGNVVTAVITPTFDVLTEKDVLEKIFKLGNLELFRIMSLHLMISNDL